MRNGEPNFNFPSRFISEIPRYLIQQTEGEKSRRSSSAYDRAAGLDDIFSPAKKYNKHSKNPFADNPYIKKGASSLSSPAGKPEYSEGDTVYHIKFGTGTVLSLTKLSTDYEVVVEFKDFGQRKLRSSFAKLSKI